MKDYNKYLVQAKDIKGEIRIKGAIEIKNGVIREISAKEYIEMEKMEKKKDTNDKDSFSFTMVSDAIAPIED